MPTTKNKHILLGQKAKKKNDKLKRGRRRQAKAPRMSDPWHSAIPLPLKKV